MNQEFLGLLSLLAVLAILLVPMVYFEDTYLALTGRAFHAAKGGTINYVELTVPREDIPNWHGVYGFILSLWGSPTPIEFNGSAGDFTNINVRSNVTSGYVIITTTNSTPSLSDLSPGNVSLLDEYTGNGSDSATNTFISTSDFRINSTTISGVPVATLYATATQTGIYKMYLFSYNGSFAIAVPIEESMLGFNGQIMDYQAMVPQGNTSSNLTYYLHVFMNYTAPVIPPPASPSGGGTGSSGGGGGGGGISEISDTKDIVFEGPFQLNNNTDFAESMSTTWDLDSRKAVIEYSKSIKGNFSGTVSIYSDGKIGVLTVVVRNSGDKLNNVVLWTRMPSYFVGDDYMVSAPGGRAQKINDLERAFVYKSISTGEEFVIIHRVQRGVNASVLNDTVFEIYAEAYTEALPGICVENQTSCLGKDIVLCTNGTWTSIKTCDFACEMGECVIPAIREPPTVYLFILFLVWLITLFIIVIVIILFKKIRDKKKKRFQIFRT